MPERTEGYGAFIEALRTEGCPDVSRYIYEALKVSENMDITEELRQVDKLKGWLDSFRPFPAAVVLELSRRYDVRFTYHSNALEGNTLTQSETEIVLSSGITIGGKTLREHLEVIGHKEAIDYMRELSMAATAIG